jgi:hypothetical protein
MSEYGIVDIEKLDTELLSLANKIREKGGTSTKLDFYKGEFTSAVDAIKSSDGTGEERPTETKVFINDWMEQANSDVSGIDANFPNLILFKSIKDDAIDYTGKKIAKIEYSFDEGVSWVDVVNFIDTSTPPTQPNPFIQINKSVNYNDGVYDTVCFGSIYFPVNAVNSQYILEIQNGNQYGFRVTYYTD